MNATTTGASASLRDAVRSAIPPTTALRHDLHQHPELSYQERRTSAAVVRELAAFGVEHTPGLAGGTGVLGFIPSTESPERARTIALRADMDALPITEKTGRPYASRTAGIMHACGHDGHTAILLGAARVLSGLERRPHNVTLVFQPAEEGGAGGERMCKDGALSGAVRGRPVDMIYGLHGWPELPIGTVATRSGPLLAATDDFIVTVKGKGGHAAYPHLCVDPVYVAAQIITAVQSVVSRRTNPADAAVVTIATIHAGTANNIIPDSVELTGTLRTLRPETRLMAEQEFRRVVGGVAQGLGAQAEIRWHTGYPVTANDPETTERFRRIARGAFGADRVLEREYATMGGEDFSFYGQHVPACFFFLGLRPQGARECPGLHTPEFDFNDDALPVAIELMCRLATEPL